MTMPVRFQIKLEQLDFRALRRLADSEYRDPRQMASYLIREALEQRGLIVDRVPQITPHTHKGAADGT